MQQSTDSASLAQLQAQHTVLQAQVAQLAEQLAAVQAAQTKTDGVSLVVSTADMDRLLMAYIIATGAASMGMQASMFFAFWGLAALRKKGARAKKGLMQQMLGAMQPEGLADAKLSRLHMFGLGKQMMQAMMAKHHVATLPELAALAQELGVQQQACQMTMGLMGIDKAEIIAGVGFCGVASYLETASRSSISLHI